MLRPGGLERSSLLLRIERPPFALASTTQLALVIVAERGTEIIFWRCALIQNFADGATSSADIVAQVVKCRRLAEDALDAFIECAADELRRTNAFPFGGLIEAT